MHIYWLVRVAKVWNAVRYFCVHSGIQQEDKQRHCLELGKEAGLDIAMVTKTVVENIRDTRTVSL